MRLSSRLPWYGLLGAVVLVPIVVGAAPLSGVPLTLNVFVQAKLIVLCLTMAFTLATWGLITWREGSLYSGRALLPLAAFVLVATAATATGIDRRTAFFGDWEQGVGLLVFLLCAFVCFVTTQLVRDEAHLTELTSVAILGATVVASVGLAQQLFGFDLTGIIPRDATTGFLMRRGFGTIGNADTYAAFLVLPTFLATVRFTRSTDRRERLTWGACFAVILSSCIAAQTRGPLIGLLAGAALYVVAGRIAASQAVARKHKGAKKSDAPAGPAVAIVVATVASGFLIAATLANGDFLGTWRDFAVRFGSVRSLMALGGRIPLWSAALEMAASHPLLGVGPDSFRLGWYPIRTIEHVSAGTGLVITDPHSVPLLLAATMGFTGLLAAGYLLISALATGFTFAQRERAARGHASDYDAWLFGLVALSVTYLTSMLASVLLFTLFLAIGVLIAPSLRRSESPRWNRGTLAALGVASTLAAGALLVFSLLGAAGQVTAASAVGADVDTTASRFTRAASLSPWDSQLRRMKHDAVVQAALDRVFTGKPDAEKAVTAAEAELRRAAQLEPAEYLYPYRTALLLIGSGQRLGDEYTARGVEAGLRGLRIYPNSLELRTGVASGYVQLNKAKEAEGLLKGVWDADPNYARSGITYAQALLGQKKVNDARTVLSVLGERFPDDPAVSELMKQIPPT